MRDWSAFEIGYDVPALPGMALSDVQTPALVVDLDALERNLDRMRTHAAAAGMRLRAHAKSHKSADIAALQIGRGGACGICCQKVSEAEAMVRAGIGDILVTNEVRDPVKLDRLARLAERARIVVCVDDPENVGPLSRAARRHGVTVEALVEIDCGAGRCGIRPGAPAVGLAQAIAAAEGLRFAGLQAYHGPAQHIADPAERAATIAAAADVTARTVSLLWDAGLACDIVGGAGTGSFPFEARSGVYNELQCGSYVFMDADYERIRAEDGGRVGGFENALFVLTSVMSRPRPDRAVCDAGLKALAVDSGLPRVFGREGVRYDGASDEHGVLAIDGGDVAIDERIRLVPGHCDPTCNLHDWFVALRGETVETLWPVTARGKVF
ncbi:DSD1 family PLP-dependent enzyme [Jiella avicenniae]|uniref:DSD1 family PLP-dependent enzyme n=1 Tax=Jiella avicenniae TaxID=2907202 RepID=A0A9X1TB20_9HYPH|nr:DSD1 family PLP-dependent enzyme [Jiella avicenniae]MCE7027703.1 DSD1 family PLP-dependent enzyme [Jiella avicenniae]MCE7028745.1 DSD1 family PLP-dependent enzyme [Jiella avicenniae]